MNTVNIADLCRLCVNQSYYHANIFQKRLLDGNRIFETLNAICQLNIVEGDDLPEYICVQCSCKVSDIEVFKQSSREGRVKLLSLKKKVLAVDLVPDSACFSVFCEPLQVDLVPRSESFSVFCEPLKENIQSVIDLPDNEELVPEEVEVSSVSDYCTSVDDLDSESAQCIRECSLEDDDSAMGFNSEGTLGLRNLERDGMPQRIQNESAVKVNKETAGTENRSSDYTKEISEQCRIEDVCTYKSRLRSKTRNINEKVSDQHPKAGNDSECRVFSNKSDCPKRPLKDSIANTSSRQKVPSSDKKTVVKPGLTRKRSKSRGNKGTKHFFCDICGKGFPIKQSLIRHIWFHIGFRPYKCSICSKSFVTKSNLQRHNSVHVTKRAHVCKDCGKSFKDLRKLNIHMKVHRPFSCETCGKCFRTRLGLKLHGQVHRPDQHPKFINDSGCRVFSNISDCPKKPLKDSIANTSSRQKVQSLDKKTVVKPGLTPKGSDSRGNKGTKHFFCNMCGKVFPKKQNLDVHIRFHIGFRPYKCSICSKSFVTKSNLQDHNYVHVTERAHACKECGKSFKDLRKLNIHMKVHRPFSCKTCRKCFTSTFRLKQHELVHRPDQHPKSSNDSGCRGFSNKSVCPKKPLKDSIANTSSRQKVQSLDKKTVVKPGLTRKRSKLRGNKGTKRFFCDMCRKECLSKSTLIRHIWFHIGFRPYKCSICSKSFVTKSNLQRHNYVHVTERTHVCKECGKSFKDLCTLNMHMKIHRPFSCKTCKKCFTTKIGLEKHGLVHKPDSKEYSCSVCNMSFKLKINLIDHIHTHDNSGIYKCSKCDKVFPFKYALRNHMQTHSTKGPFNCPNCDKSFKWKNNIRFHMRNSCKGM